MNYPLSRNVLSSTVIFGQVRCANCGKLMLKAHLVTGSVLLDMKCSRCGNLDVVMLST